MNSNLSRGCKGTLQKKIKNNKILSKQWEFFIYLLGESFNQSGNDGPGGHGGQVYHGLVKVVRVVQAGTVVQYDTVAKIWFKPCIAIAHLSRPSSVG